jgi:hypothetical protein
VYIDRKLKKSSAEVKNGGAVPPLSIRLPIVLLNYLDTGFFLFDL